MPELVKVRTAPLWSIGIRTSVTPVGCRNAGGPQRVGTDSASPPAGVPSLVSIACPQSRSCGPLQLNPSSTRWSAHLPRMPAAAR